MIRLGLFPFANWCGSRARIDLPVGVCRDVAMKSLLTLSLLLFLCLDAPGREFKGRNGKVIDAEVVSKSPGKVLLKLESGKEVEVPLSSLSEADQLYVAVWESPEERAKQLKAVKLNEALEAQGYIPLSLSLEEGQLYVTVSADSQSLKLLVSHQNDQPILRKASADEKGMKIKPVEGGGGQILGTCTPELVGNGDKGIKNLEFLVADLSNLPAGVDGLIGGQVFVDHPARLDFVAKQLWIKVD